LYRLHHPALACEKTRDVFALIGQPGNRIGRSRPLSFTNVLPMIALPPSWTSAAHPPSRRPHTAPGRPTAGRANMAGRTTPAPPRTRCRVRGFGRRRLLFPGSKPNRIRYDCHTTSEFSPRPEFSASHSAAPVRGAFQIRRGHRRCGPACHNRANGGDGRGYFPISVQSGTIQ
jgi:hypothetical protein